MEETTALRDAIHVALRKAEKLAEKICALTKIEPSTGNTEGLREHLKELDDVILRLERIVPVYEELYENTHLRAAQEGRGQICSEG